jgi:transcriptional regulator with XRE-family HTH domain
MSNIIKKLGLELKLIRIEAGIKQKDLAKKLKIPAPLLSMYETGVREPPIEFLELFAKKFKISISRIFFLLENKKTPLWSEEDLQKAKEEARKTKILLNW